MRDLGEIALGLDQEIRVGDEGTCRGDRYRCIKFIPRPPHYPPLQLPPNDAEHWENISSFTTLPSSTIIGQFGIRLRSTGDEPDRAGTYVILKTSGASNANPYIVTFDQFMIEPFTGPGQFDLVERDASDVDVLNEDYEVVSGGETKADVADKAGLKYGLEPMPVGQTGGDWSHVQKVITVDKIFTVVFVPGDTGDGVISIMVRSIGQF